MQELGISGEKPPTAEEPTPSVRPITIDPITQAKLLGKERELEALVKRDVTEELLESGKRVGKGREGVPEEIPTFSTKSEADRWLRANNLYGEHKPLLGGKLTVKNLRLREGGGDTELFSGAPITFTRKNDRWFSKLQEAVATDYSNWPKKANGADIVQRVKKLMAGGKFKKEEFEDMGRLNGVWERVSQMKGATRDQILDEIMSSGIEVEERLYRSPKDMSHEQLKRFLRSEDYEDAELNQLSRDEFRGVL